MRSCDSEWGTAIYQMLGVTFDFELKTCFCVSCVSCVSHVSLCLMCVSCVMFLCLCVGGFHSGQLGFLFLLTDARSALEVASNLLVFSTFQIPSNLHTHFCHVLTLFDMLVQTRWGRCAAAPTDLGVAWAPSPSPSPTTPSLRVPSQLHRTAHGLRAHRLHWGL